MIRIKEQPWKWLCLLAIFILADIGGKFIAVQLKLPVWMDCVGTCLAAYYLGGWGAVIVGLAGNIVFGITDLASALYAVVSIVLALIFRYCARKGYLENLTQAMISSFAAGMAAVIASTPINLFFQGGYTGNIWGDALFDMMQWYGYPRLLAAVMDEGIVDFFDKQLCVLAVYLLIRLINKIKSGRKPGKAASSAVLGAVMVVGACAAFVFPFRAYAQEEAPASAERAESPICRQPFGRQLFYLRCRNAGGHSRGNLHIEDMLLHRGKRGDHHH